MALVILLFERCKVEFEIMIKLKEFDHFNPCYFLSQIRKRTQGLSLIPLAFFVQVLFFLPGFFSISLGQTLSTKATISIITCGPGPSLYEAFGHSAIRVKDSLNGMDLVFNYGVFDFNQPNFYGNFAKGYMRYMLGVNPFDEFLFQYKYFKRSVREQVLNVDSAQKQAILQYLKVNLEPENRAYYYAYFDNNCSTKIIELLDSALSHQVFWNPLQSDGQATFRSMIHQYTIFQDWGRLGIDIGLGSKIDKPMTGRQFDFLPDFVEQDLNRAWIGPAVQAKPLVSETRVLYQSDFHFGFSPWWQMPGFVFSLLLCLNLLINLAGDRWSGMMRVWGAIQLILVGLLGIVILSIWLFTNHVYAGWNFNLLWANPIFLLVGIWCLFRKTDSGRFQRPVFLYLFLVLMVWFLVPQHLNEQLIPLVMALLLAHLPKFSFFKPS